MLSHFPIVGFIPITNPERARKFYCDVLKLEFIEDEPYAVVVNANGITVRLVKMEKSEPADFTVMGWEVPDVAATVQDLIGAGIAIERYSFIEQDAHGIWSAPDGRARLAWFKDPDGNVLSVSQHVQPPATANP
jgi:catechol 2,3-dioxygenase-like lactoylglutathione lyase family enzyme